MTSIPQIILGVSPIAGSASFAIDVDRHFASAAVVASGPCEGSVASPRWDWKADPVTSLRGSRQPIVLGLHGQLEPSASPL
jgi:hypothetical protein